MSGINLLPREVQEKQHKTQRAAVVNAVSIVLIVLVASVLSIVFSYNTYLVRQINGLDEQIKFVSDDIQQKKSVEGELQSLKVKLSALADVSASDYAYEEALVGIKGALSDNGLLSTIQRKGSSLSVEAQLPSLPAVARMLQVLEDRGYQGVQLVKIDYAAGSGQYAFTMTVPLPKLNGSKAEP